MKKLIALTAFVLVVCSAFAYNYWVTASLVGEDVSGGASSVILKYKVTLAGGEQYSDFKVHVNSQSNFAGSTNMTQTITNDNSITVNLSSFSGLQPYWRLEDQSGTPITGSRQFTCP